MMALVLVDENAPMPVPVSTMPAIMCRGGESVVSCEKRNIPAVEHTIAPTDSQRVPSFSDTRPTIGAMRAIEAEPGSMNRAALLAW